MTLRIFIGSSYLKKEYGYEYKNQPDLTISSAFHYNNKTIFFLKMHDTESFDAALLSWFLKDIMYSNILFFLALYYCYQFHHLLG